MRVRDTIIGLLVCCGVINAPGSTRGSEASSGSRWDVVSETISFLNKEREANASCGAL